MELEVGCRPRHGPSYLLSAWQLPESNSGSHFSVVIAAPSRLRDRRTRGLGNEAAQHRRRKGRVPTPGRRRPFPRPFPLCRVATTHNRQRRFSGPPQNAVAPAGKSLLTTDPGPRISGRHELARARFRQPPIEPRRRRRAWPDRQSRPRGRDRLSGGDRRLLGLAVDPQSRSTRRGRPGSGTSCSRSRS